MSQSENDFDYEAILNEYVKQDAVVKKSLSLKEKFGTKFQDTIEDLKVENVDLNGKLQILEKYRFMRKQHLQKLRNIHNKQHVMNKKLNDIQQDLTQNFAKRQKKSDQFVDDMKKTEQEIQNLYSEFDEEILLKQINDCEGQLYVSQNYEQQLEKEYMEIKNMRTDMKSYQRCEFFKTCFNDESKKNTLDLLSREISEISNNIQVYNQKIAELLPSNNVV